MDREKLAKLASAVRTGGKGTMRRKKKAVHKTATTDDKRLQSTLKRLGVNTIPGIEEVNIFQGDSVIHFVNPKVQASIAANTYVVSGPSQTKSVAEMIPPNLQQMLAQMQMQGGLPGGLPDMAALQKMAQQMGGGAGLGGPAEEDDDVPDLVENFEESAKITEEAS
ncbi:Transcription factor BTF3 [Monoraphidium neglectum]|uniref:Nascent polypeptide-associated complex subunit beta n=1 Tax=Monoraphidium neglectum TaxID=145388 RepID=A0A0D2LE63_9CHLO|nr:Transcription factor BTF3 [Monoraphidium neglectum]KIZ04989.1 Transcription factor BTF3 [Monoraphidium neglectum]|eukprot:XP_013904008.1 Transcription factor BTF3 [Monoraphidium neglectum]